MADTGNFHWGGQMVPVVIFGVAQKLVLYENKENNKNWNIKGYFKVPYNTELSNLWNAGSGGIDEMIVNLYNIFIWFLHIK